MHNQTVSIDRISLACIVCAVITALCVLFVSSHSEVLQKSLKNNKNIQKEKEKKQTVTSVMAFQKLADRIQRQHFFLSLSETV